jgi:hypothetical protein
VDSIIVKPKNARDICKGDRVKILACDKLFNVLKARSFYNDDDIRLWVSNIAGGQAGVIHLIADRSERGYFYFIPDGDRRNFSLPYQAIDFSGL